MIETAITPELLRGRVDLELTTCGLALHRLPAWVRQQYPDPQLLAVESQPSGVRLTFESSAEVIELVTHSHVVAYRGVDRPRGVVDVHVDDQLFSRSSLTGG